MKEKSSESDLWSCLERPLLRWSLVGHWSDWSETCAGGLFHDWFQAVNWWTGSDLTAAWRMASEPFIVCLVNLTGCETRPSSPSGKSAEAGTVAACSRSSHTYTPRRNQYKIKHSVSSIANLSTWITCNH